MFHWMLMPYRRYAEFTGRSQRMEYWLFWLFFYVVVVLLIVLMFAGLPWGEIEDPGAAPGPIFWAGLAGSILFFLVSFVPGIAVTVRRFHDQDLTGWLYLLNFVPYIGALIVLVFMCLDGTRGPNRFGDDPKDCNMGEVFA